ncbi:MAG: hypothetical protein KBE09_04080 [Candidatus Pacebacteria bacterium]|nr:hypothetical protein [Candidatus Paceibacterota bacterium]
MSFSYSTWETTVKAISSITSPLWDAVVASMFGVALYFLPEHYLVAMRPEILTLVVGPAILATFGFARHRFRDEAFINFMLAAAGIMAIGVLMLFSAGLHSALLRPEETQCSTYGCSWNPIGISAALFGGSLLIMLFAIVEFSIAAAALGFARLVTSRVSSQT